MTDEWKERASYLFLSMLMHFVITANIHEFSSSPAGGWKATFLPACKGSCLARASRLAFGSRENRTDGVEPPDLRGGNVMETPLPVVAFAAALAAAAVNAGERGRLFRFALSLAVILKRDWEHVRSLACIPAGIASGADLRAIKILIFSMVWSIALSCGYGPGDAKTYNDLQDFLVGSILNIMQCSTQFLVHSFETVEAFCGELVIRRPGRYQAVHTTDSFYSSRITVYFHEAGQGRGGR
jgi:hypothetical protein